MLFQKERHQNLNKLPWSEAEAQETVAELFLKSLKAFDPENLWPTHPDEDAKNPVNYSLYFGATGTLLGLMRISDFLNINLPFRSSELIDVILKKYLKEPDTGDIVPSYFLGTSGIRLVHFGLNRTQAMADQLFQDIEGNINNPVNEALWGCPGSMLASLQMYDWTGEERWKAQYLRNVDYLLDQWKPIGPNESWVWTQDLYGSKVQLIGAGHGFCGNVFPILKGQYLLNESVKNDFFEKVTKTLLASAQTQDNLTNWPATFQDVDSNFRLQWCHGAPGVITSMGDFPKGFSSELETCLLQAGDLIWKAGPLNKGVALCHGTDGNAMAFLKLFERTGNDLWLKRARAFAMHAQDQVSQRHTLWTGDIGYCQVLVSCIERTSQWLSLDTLGRLTPTKHQPVLEHATLS